MQKIKALQDEIIYLETLSSGLKVAILPKRSFKKSIVSLQVNFGGLDYLYEVNQKIKKNPFGVAHFLEHIIFSNNGINVSEVFSKHGANINAYTSKSITSYKFNTTENFNYLLGFFLNCFINPEFSFEAIEKERKIIIHELNMSSDSIHHKIYRKLLSLMYNDNAIRADVGGEISDVKKIDNGILTDVFNTFYHPKNMTLVITGNVNPEAVFSFLRKHPYNLKNWSSYSNPQRVKEDKSRKKHSFTKVIKNNHQNLISIGIKIPNQIFSKYSKEFIHISLASLNNNVFGLASKNFDTLKKLKLMNVSFSSTVNIERDYGFINIYIQTKKVKKYSEVILQMIDDVCKKPLDKELFINDRNMIIGNYITLFDSLSRIHEFIASSLSENICLKTYFENVMNLKLADLNQIKNIYCQENVFSVKYLKEKK